MTVVALRQLPMLPLVLVLVIGLVILIVPPNPKSEHDYEHRGAEHEQDKGTPINFSAPPVQTVLQAAKSVP